MTDLPAVLGVFPHDGPGVLVFTCDITPGWER